MIQPTQIKVTGQQVTLRSIKKEDIPTLYHLMYGERHPEWKKWDAPYIPLNPTSYEDFSASIKRHIETVSTPSRLVIEADQHVIGTVSYYWMHEASKWLEVGIVIFKPQYWNGGYGSEALSMWRDLLFSSDLQLVRLGLTTWSGNIRMVRCAEKIGMIEEARIRKARYYDGVYYDSIKMGMLREEWDELVSS
ncbi:GNAT family N-acetyltransferase [Caldalkalibacillus salinus]|uniref:GNAT family N-acetyltransferase n=1 Tax=Caldalkalibacillus salinus TaxID=2803787 RepID=UPI001922509D|nr:GNAT family protein [Caldalkalibacillus salinus]